MANSTASKPRPPSRKGMGPTPGSFKPGDPRINRKGVPRRALAAAEAVRELVDPEDWVAFELAIANDESQPLEVRRASWHALVDRGFVRAPAGLDINVSRTEPEPTLDEVKALIAEHERLDRLALARATGQPVDADARDAENAEQSRTDAQPANGSPNRGATEDA